MASVFRKDDNFAEQPKRNTYDMTFTNNLTTRFGALRPCLCLPVQPGDSFEIEPTFGLDFLPFVYPVQTRMKASIHYFYVRNRNLWKDFPDFIGKTKEGLVPPYVHLNSTNRKMVETCELGDYLGIPTELYGGIKDRLFSYYFTPDQYDLESESFLGTRPFVSRVDFGSDYISENYSDLFGASGFPSNLVLISVPAGDYSDTKLAIHYDASSLHNTDTKFIFALYSADNGSLVYKKVSAFDEFSQQDIIVDYQFPTDRNNAHTYVGVFVADSHDYSFFGSLSCVQASDLQRSASEMNLSELPWRSDDRPSGIPLSALPFRAYESVYNSFYRNAENNPLLVNGVPEYNKWIATQEGGADTNYYPIHYHNWEDDFLTTAVPSPQQGNAPLVGLTGTPTATFAHEDGSVTNVDLNVDDDGNVTSVVPRNGDDVTTLALMEAVQYGITINDFRNVNAFQRWLENNIRRGYKYRDQIKTHFGVTVRYDELDMPEFIGGVSEPVMVNRVSQTVPTEFSPLGDKAGQASCVGNGKRITHYCDEHGFIIGILCVKPVANYSQLLPKFFNVTDTFDYFFPEFGHIGMQPIFNWEVAPMQAAFENNLDEVFGYQRAWYDLISKTDEVHGLFRSDFRKFLINRTFDGVPQLGKSFTVMDPEQINNVFAYTGDTDKILGQVFQSVSKKTAIPLYGIPKLE